MNKNKGIYGKGFVSFLFKKWRALPSKRSWYNDTNKQLKYLRGLPIPDNDFARSFLQYKCQMKFHGIIRIILENVASFFLLLYFRLKLKVHESEGLSNRTAVLVNPTASKDLIPDEICNEVDTIHTIEAFRHNYIDSVGMQILKEINRAYPLSFFFKLKCFLKLTAYANIVEEKHPQMIIATGEESFTSSILTYYCERKKIKHVCIMHGVRNLCIHYSYARFQVFYVWDNEHKEIFLNLMQPKEQFRIGVPKALVFDLPNKIPKAVDFTYYLQGVQSEAIKEQLAMIKSKGYSVAVRPHPVYDDYTHARIFFEDFEVEDPSEIDIMTSILRTRNAIAVNSTVLYQAGMNGVNVVFDDVTNPRRYKLQCTSGLVTLKKPHELLSRYTSE